MVFTVTVIDYRYGYGVNCKHLTNKVAVHSACTYVWSFIFWGYVEPYSRRTGMVQEGS